MEKDVKEVNDLYDHVNFAKIDRGLYHQIRLYYKEFMKDNGSIYRFIDVREFYFADSGTFLPMKKGCSIPMKDWIEFFNGVVELNDYLRENNLLEE